MALHENKSKSAPEMLKRLAEENPSKEAFVFIDKYGDRITFSRKDVWEYSRRFAAILKRHGIDKGDLVCNTLTNSPERLLTALGTMTAGAITMNGQLLLADGEDLLRNLRQSQCKSIIVDIGKSNEVLTFLDRISYKDENTGQTRYKDLPFLTKVIKLKVYSEEKEKPLSRFLYNLENETEMFVNDDIHEDDMAAVFNTSGTTGFSKLVPYTHRKLFLNFNKICNMWSLTGESVLFSDRFLGWMGGFPYYYLVSGTKMVMIDRAHGLPEDMALHMLRELKTEKCTHGNVARIDLERMLVGIKSDETLAYMLDTIIVGGGPMSSLITTVIEVIARKVITNYGGTEFGPISSFLITKDIAFEDYCTGRVLDEIEVKILDANLERVSQGNHGEVFVRSSYITDGYLNDPDKTKESFLDDGWFRTGDLGYEDDRGQLFVLGRMTTAIMKGSYVLYPGWLEQQILKCPGIQSVAVIGVPDPVLYEDICLCVESNLADNLTEETVKEFCQNLFLTSEKEEITPMPKYFLFFDEFPYNQNLKIDRAALKAKACKRLNISMYGLK